MSEMLTRKTRKVHLNMSIFIGNMPLGGPVFSSLKNKMPAILALRVMLGLTHLFQLYPSPIDKTILANGIV